MTCQNKKQLGIVYLDIDDTLITWTESGMVAAPDAGSFVRWLHDHFEVRWLTAWAPIGKLWEHDAAQLAWLLNEKKVDDTLSEMIWLLNKESINPRSWQNLKTDAIDFDDSRPWIWIEDDILDREKVILADKKVPANWIRCNVTEDINAILKTWDEVAKKFNVTVCKDCVEKYF